MKDNTQLFEQLLSLEKLQPALQRFCTSTGVGCIIVNSKGEVMFEENWQCFCKRHSVRFSTPRVQCCIETEPLFAEKIHNDEKSIIFTCNNGFSSIGAPIIIDGLHIASVFIGLFFLSPPDREEQQKVVSVKGFDEVTFLKAVGAIPVLSAERLQLMIGQLELTAALLGEMGRNALLERQVNQQLSKSEERYRNMINYLPEVIFETDLRGVLLFTNKSALETFGYTPQELNDGIDMFQLISASDHEKAAARFKALLSGQILEPDEYLFRHKDGSLFPAMVFCRAIYTDGVIRGVGGIIIDITQRKQAEEKLQQSERKLQSLFQAVPVGLTILQDRTFRSVNERFCEITGYAATDLLNHNSRFLYESEEEFNRVGPTLYDNLREQGTSYVETRFCHRDGSLRSVALSAAPLTPHDLSAGAAVAIQDITERKKTERALRESEFRFRSFYNSNPEGIILLDFKGIIVDVNKAFMENSGYSLSDCALKNLKDFIPEKHQSLLVQTIVTIRSGISQTEPLRISYIAKNGEKIPISVRGWLVMDEESVPLYLGVFIHDLSKEMVLAKEKAALEKQVIHAQKSEAIGTLAGGIAHDFNNILGGIIGYTELALHRAPLVTDDKARNYLEKILEGGNRAKELVKQILRFSKHSNTAMKPIHLSPVINEAINLLRSTLPTTITIRHQVDLDGDRIFGDSTQILQVVMNLATNAYHVMRENGGILTITLESVTLTTAKQFMSMVIPPGEYLRLRVADTGSGIKPAVLERIFEPYFTTKKINEGSGLGMAVAKGIVNSHKGLIEIETALGKGTSVDVFLPFTQRNVAKFDYVEKRLPLGHGQHVLIVDDEPYYLEVVEEKLKLLGYQVTASQSSLNALKIFRDNPQGYDLLITDQTMPEMTGVQLTKEIRRISNTIPVILCTGYSETVTEQSTSYYGITGFLMKPVNVYDLAKLINTVLPKKIAK